MNYEVLTVGDDELPDGRNVVIVEREDGAALMLINGMPGRVWALMRAWEDEREPCVVPSILRLAPRQDGWMALARDAAG